MYWYIDDFVRTWETDGKGRFTINNNILNTIYFADDQTVNYNEF